MNADQDNVNAPWPADSATPFHPGIDSRLAAALSALTDGEIGEDELDAVLAGYDEQPGLQADWHAYQVIGDVLRGNAGPVPVCAPQDFVAGIRARIQTAAPSVQVTPVNPAVIAHVRGEAANDPVMRWKVAAGLASLAAVLAVSWSVMRGAPGTDGGVGAQPQLAQLQGPAKAPQASAALDAPPATVAVNTGQGVLIRDARLEQMLAEHRQYGGMSALQMPAGFLRNATYDAAPQR